MQVPGFTVCVLCYGDHTDLAQRCLGSISRTLDKQHVVDLRVGLNDVCPGTREYVFDVLRSMDLLDPPLIYEPERNVHKYPLMRRMFYDKLRPVQSTHLMWFDDDSCITDGPDWWAKTWAKAQQYTMIGDIWYVPYRGHTEWVRRQSWYTGKPFHKIRGREAMKFATGGWWAAEFLPIRRWSYPWQELNHRGGDCSLGEMLNQQGYTLGKHKDGLWINADDRGKNSGAPRRGYDERPVWYDYRPEPDLSHHRFDYQVHEAT